LKLIQQDAIEKSVTYSYVQPWGPKVINSLGALIPVFKNMFSELESFFGDIAAGI
jgi:membrane protein required for colicin V production